MSPSRCFGADFTLAFWGPLTRCFGAFGIASTTTAGDGESCECETSKGHGQRIASFGINDTAAASGICVNGVATGAISTHRVATCFRAAGSRAASAAL